MKKIEQINSFNYFTIQTYNDSTREWKLSSLVELYEDNGTIIHKYIGPSIVCVDLEDSEQEEIFSADNDKWIVDTFYEYLKIKKDKPNYLLNDSSFDDLELKTNEIIDIIELLELGFKLGMLNKE